MSFDRAALRDDLLRQIGQVADDVWEGRCKGPEVHAWLNNFTGNALQGDDELERLLALYLLVSLSYFGVQELRILLRHMYTELFRYPLVQAVHQTSPSGGVDDRLAEELRATRFLGMGNPSESGAHLLYYFRQESGLPTEAFTSVPDLLTGPASDPATRLAIQGLKRLVFIDDVCGTGTQARHYARTVLSEIDDVARRTNVSLEVQYLVLFGTTRGLARVSRSQRFSYVKAVHVLDEAAIAFGADSHLFEDPPDGLTREDARLVAMAYGKKLSRKHPLGYKSSQLLLAFSHNVPNNTLPIIWAEEPGWAGAFPRVGKKERW